MITIQRAQVRSARDGKPGEVIDGPMLSVRRHGVEVGFIHDRNPSILMLHRYFAPEEKDRIVEACRLILKTEDLECVGLDKWDPPQRALAGDL